MRYRLIFLHEKCWETGFSRPDLSGSGKVSSPHEDFSTGARFSLQMLSAISNHGELRFTVHERSVAPDTFFGFLTRLAQRMERNLQLVVHDHSIQKTGDDQKRLTPFAARSSYA